ncbi:Golgin subfamily A member 2 [Trichinella nelsoni]|uniref:Golgin subfamily A member 2 n=1 Tax=Trichinella nelsoni TaxID=6336 RepID=A0A0V0RWY9_9BILA|nr:Golgin subfamily A member 2 [Trichinella nelsoni]
MNRTKILNEVFLVNSLLRREDSQSIHRKIITNDKQRMGSLHSPFQALNIWPRLYSILDSFTFSSIASPKNFPKMQPRFGQRESHYHRLHIHVATSFHFKVKNMNGTRNNFPITATEKKFKQKNYASTDFGSSDVTSTVFETVDDESQEHGRCNARLTMEACDNNFQISDHEDSDSLFTEFIDNPSSTLEKYKPLNRFELNQLGFRLYDEFQEIIHLADEYQTFVDNKNSDEDLQNHINLKLRFILERLDVEIKQLEWNIQKTMQHCRIHDKRLQWLPIYCKSFKRYRKIVRRLTTDVLDQVERVVTLKARGCDNCETPFSIKAAIEAAQRYLQKTEYELRKPPLQLMSMCNTLTCIEMAKTLKEFQSKNVQKPIVDAACFNTLMQKKIQHSFTGNVNLESIENSSFSPSSNNSDGGVFALNTGPPSVLESEMSHTATGAANDFDSNKQERVNSNLQKLNQPNMIAPNLNFFQSDFTKNDKTVANHYSQGMSLTRNQSEIELENSLLKDRLRAEQESKMELEKTYQALVNWGNFIQSEYNKLRTGKEAPSAFEERNSLLEEIQTHTKIIGVLVEEKSSLQSQLRQAKEMFKALQMEHVSMQMKFVQRQEMDKNATTMINELQAENAALKSSVQQQGIQLTTQRYELTRQLHGLSILQQDKNELSVKLKAQSELIESMKEAEKKLKRSLESREIYAKQLSQALTNSEAGNGNDRSERTTFSILEEKQAEIDKLNAEMNTVKQQLLEAKQSFEKYEQSAEEKIAISSREIQKHQAEKSTLLMKLEQLETELKALQSVNKVESVVERDKNLDADVIESMKLVSELHCELEIMNKRVQQLEIAVQEKELHISNLELQLREKIDYARNCQSILEQLHSERVTAGRALAQNHDLKERLCELQNKFVEMSEANAVMTDRLQTLTSKLASENVKSTTDSYTSMTDEEQCSFCTNSCNNSDNTLVELNMKIEQLTIENDYLKQCLAANLSEVDQDTTTTETSLVESEINFTSVEQLAINEDTSANSENITDVQSLEVEKKNNAHLCTEHQNLSDRIETLSEEDEKLQNRMLSLNASLAAKELLSSSDRFASGRRNNGQSTEDLLRSLHELQQRFIQAMNENASLTDRNQRMEHMIIQLQSETETIGEFVTLYQHQRRVVRQRLIEKEEYVAQIAREKEVMKEKVAELRLLFVDLLRERNMLKAYSHKAAGQSMSRGRELDDIKCPVRLSQTVIDETVLYNQHPGGQKKSVASGADVAVGEVNLSNEKRTDEKVDNSLENEKAETDGSLVDRIMNLLAEIQNPEMVNQLPSQGPQMHCKYCTGKIKIRMHVRNSYTIKMNEEFGLLI